MQGYHASSWKALYYFVEFPVLENDFGPGKSRKFKLEVLESPGICWDTDTMMQMRKYSRPHTSSFCDLFYSDKVSVCLYLHVAGDYDKVLENTFGTL